MGHQWHRSEGGSRRRLDGRTWAASARLRRVGIDGGVGGGAAVGVGRERERRLCESGGGEGNACGEIRGRS